MRARWQAIYKCERNIKHILFSMITQGSWNKCNYHKNELHLQKDIRFVNKVLSKYKMIMCDIQRGSRNSLEFMDVCAVGLT